MKNTSEKISVNRKQEIALNEIKKALNGLEYGCVNISVQDGIVVQIERVSKDRLDYSILEKVTGGEGI